MQIRVCNLSYTYPDAPEPALDGLSASFPEGWTGIVGNNGAGKSTLAKLVCGLLSPDGGSVSPFVPGAYCSQSAELPPANLEDLALDYSAHAVRVRRSLDVDDEWLWRFASLSHGERKRVQIACALHLDPPLLVLDEPTNHLDAETRGLLSRALASYRGIGLLVSHDRALLNELARQCLFMSNGTAKAFPGGYDRGKAQLDLECRTVAAERTEARKDLARLQGERARRATEAERTASRRSKRHLDAKDSDGRARIGLAVVSGQDGKAGRISTQMDKRIERVRARLDDARVEKGYDGEVSVSAEPSPRKVLLRIPASTVPLGDRRRLLVPNLFIGNLDRIGIAGPNGSGKSTLVGRIVSALSPDIGAVHLPQEIDEDSRREVLARVRALSPAERGRLLSIAARLDSPPERILSGDDVSPGEARKLLLAYGLLNAPQLIVLDEPTNHLDVRSIEALERMLSSWRCALVVVSHEEKLFEAAVDVVWRFRRIGSASDGTAEGDVEIVVEPR